MKQVSGERMKKRNLRLVCLCLAAFAILMVFLSLPVYTFDTSLYTKKSGNTFVGDERYVAARAEADAAAAQFTAQGASNVRVTEDVLTRKNSKGETTSMITFRVSTDVARTGWQFLFSAMPSGKVLLAIAVAAMLSIALLLLSLPGALGIAAAELAARKRTLRRAACWLALAALVLIPVFHLYTVSVWERQLIANLAKPVTPRLTALIAAADAFVFGGSGGPEITSLLAGVDYHSTWTLWAMIPAAFALLLGAVVLSEPNPGKVLARGLLYLFVIGMCLMILYPYYVMLITAFRSNAETTDMYFTNLLPTRWVWSNIPDIVARGVPRFLLNSLLLSGGATIIALCCGIPAAYAMARMPFKGKKIFLGYVIMSQMFAPIVLLVGISQLMNTIGLNDSILGLMLINAAFNQAFAIWLLRGTFVSISAEMEQAASIDGCSTIGALMRVLLPMAAPGIVTTLIFVFINAWNEYTISTVLISTPLKKPITVGITQFSSFNMIEWQYLFASALLATIPVVILFMFIEKQLVTGLTSGGVKG